MFAISATGFIGASQFNPWLLHRYGSRRVVSHALRLSAAAVAVLAVGAFSGVGGLMGIFLPAAVALACTGLVFPNAAVGALSRHAARAGSASALLGTLQFSCAAMGSALVGALADGTPRPMAVLMVVGAAAALTAAAARPR